ncbi:hypothetical protein NKDENANG_02356 [Candidatus Entotheonellaceae bacterium PAL068K]
MTVRIWQRWFGKAERHEGESGKKRTTYSTKHEEVQLRGELRNLLQQRQILEQIGCFSDRELDEKDSQLEEFDRRIKRVKNQQFRLRTQGKIRV